MCVARSCSWFMCIRDQNTLYTHALRSDAPHAVYCYWRLHMYMYPSRTVVRVDRSRAHTLAPRSSLTLTPSAAGPLRTPHRPHQSTAAQTKKDTSMVTTSAASTWLWASSSTPRWKARDIVLSRKTPNRITSMRPLTAPHHALPCIIARALATSRISAYPREAALSRRPVCVTHSTGPSPRPALRRRGSPHRGGQGRQWTRRSCRRPARPGRRSSRCTRDIRPVLTRARSTCARL